MNDPFDMQFRFDTAINADVVKELAIQKLWEGHYENGPLNLDNDFGRLIFQIRGSFPKMDRDAFSTEYTDVIEKGLAKAQANIPDLIENFINEMHDDKIACFTVDPANAAMWAHYADNSRGIVIRFTVPGGIDSALKEARPVNYVKEIPRFWDENLASDVIAGRASLMWERHLDMMVYTKVDDWAYEQEWRIYSGRGRNRHAPFEDVPFDPLEIDGLILGENILAESKASILDIMDEIYPHAEVLQANKPRQGLKLDIQAYAR